MSEQHGHRRSDSGERARLAQLQDLITGCAQRLPAPVVAQTRAELAGVAARLDLGVEHHVVALVGGTGSGKSTLFNAVTGLDVADVGTVRPTTALPTSCAWGSEATALLDHLGVPPERRHRGEQALTGPAPGQLDGLVLLDVPDHDSVRTGHREQVDHLIPLADLLVWVLDPQKYADHRLHSDYLTALVGRQEGMLVVVNQSDLLTPAQLAELRVDVARLLVAEGLGQVEVLTTSALTLEGIGSLRESLRRLAEGASRNRVAVWDQLNTIATDLASALGPAPGPGVDVSQAVTRLAEVIGVSAVADSVEQAVRTGGSVTGLREAPGQRLAAIRAEWVEAQGHALAPAWRAAIDRVVPDPRAIGEQATTAVREIPLPTGGRVGVLQRLRPAARAKEAAEARASYLTGVHTALTTAVRRMLQPSQVLREELTAALAVLAQREGPAPD